MPKNIPNKVSEKERKEIRKDVEVIMQDCQKRSWKKLAQSQITRIKKQITDIICAYPPKLRPIIATIMVVSYLSIIPGTGITALLVFGGIGKLLTRLKNT